MWVGVDLDTTVASAGTSSFTIIATNSSNTVVGGGGAPDTSAVHRYQLLIFAKVTFTAVSASVIKLQATKSAAGATVIIRTGAGSHITAQRVNG